MEASTADGAAIEEAPPDVGVDTGWAVSVIVSPVLVVRVAPFWITKKIWLATTAPWVAVRAGFHEARSVPVVWALASNAAPASRFAPRSLEIAD